MYFSLLSRDVVYCFSSRSRVGVFVVGVVILFYNRGDRGVYGGGED